MEKTTQLIGSGVARRVVRRRACLTVTEGQDAGRAYIGSDPEITVGSAEGNALVLSDPTVSKFHLRLEARERGYLLCDLGSTNGIRVDNLAIKEALLTGPTTLRIGETDLNFSLSDEADELEVPNVSRYGDLVGQSAAMLELFSKLYAVAERNVTVLLNGETGTGKELIARAIHDKGLRKKKPYVIVDCGAIPGGLIVSELFGHTRGAFTGAHRDRQGAFEAAEGGTLFLDEIGELDENLQTLLLRVLETGEIKRAGESSHRKVDVRVIAATHRDLRELVNQGRFRADLYYRLAVISLRVPPLRDRRDDIPAIAQFLLPKIAEQLAAPEVPELSEAQLNELMTHDWPGNVRELRNVLERHLVFTGPGSLLNSEDFAANTKNLSGALDASILRAPFKEAKNAWVETFERAYIEAMLEHCDHNVAEIARQSGLARSHIFRLLKKHGIERE